MHRFTVTATYGRLMFSREIAASSYLAAMRIASELFSRASTVTVE